MEGGVSDEYKTIAFENSTWMVVRTDPSRPRLMEIIATFFEEQRAKDYAGQQNGEAAPQPFEEPAPKTPHPQRAASKVYPSEADLSPRQSAVLNALRDHADEKMEVALKAAVLAQAARIPLGSLHSVLGSLEKKGLIKTSRGGSARSPAVYRVL